jgi:hypothetical protein
MARDWKNEEDYDYTEKHTPELWAWEFLRRNPDYRKDWKIAFSSSCYKESDHPETLSFKGGRSKWGLLLDQIIDPDVEKPSVDYPYSLFYTYGYYYDKGSLNMLPEMKETEILAVIDLAKPIPQQLEHFKVLLEEDQNYSIAYSDLRIPNVRNKSIYWKDYLRILDAVDAESDFKEIAAVIYNYDDDPNNAQKKAKNSFNQANVLVNGGYRHILQQPSKMKKR